MTHPVARGLDRISRDYSVPVIGILPRLCQALASARRAPVEVTICNRLSVVSLHQRLRSVMYVMDRSPIEVRQRDSVGDSGRDQCPIRIRTLMPVVSRRYRIALRKRGGALLRVTYRERDYSAGPTAAHKHQLVVPARRKKYPKASRAIWRTFARSHYRSPDAAVLGITVRRRHVSG